MRDRKQRKKKKNVRKKREILILEGKRCRNIHHLPLGPACPVASLCLTFSWSFSTLFHLSPLWFWLVRRCPGWGGFPSSAPNSLKRWVAWLFLGKPVFPLSEHQERNYLLSLRIPISSLLSPPTPVVSGLTSQGRGQATFEEKRMQGGLREERKGDGEAK